MAAPVQESVDEIDEIMNEIEQLQQSMNTSQAAPAAKTTSRAKPVAVPAATELEPNAMEEFQAGSGEVSMEETLSNLKDDEPGGPNLIDQAIDTEAAHEELEEVGEAVAIEELGEEQDADPDELLDEAEGEALDEAILEEEEELLEEIESQGIESEGIESEGMESEGMESEEEEVPVAEAPRRGRREQGRAIGSKAGTVSLSLTGDMVLRLSYEFEGQEVNIGFSDGALRVELSDGTEFKIPFRRNSLRKVA